MNNYEVKPASGAFRAMVRVPGSKSLTNRALVMASLAQGKSTLKNVLVADDTVVMIEALRALGYAIEADVAGRTVTIEGGSPKAEKATLHCGNSGTTLRFLAAMLGVHRGEFTLDGIARMRERPVKELMELLKGLGVRCRYEMNEGYPPVTVVADGFPGGWVRFGRARSSQYLSAVLMAAPYARHEVRVDLESNQTSWPYVEMTLRLMDEFGVMSELIRDPDNGEPRKLIVPQMKYEGREYDVEPDASSASYFIASAAIHPGAEVTLEGLGSLSLQGDVGFAKLLGRMGAEVNQTKTETTVRGTGELEGIEADMSDMPDMAQTLAVVAVFAKGRTRLSGLHTLRVKETDRVAALQAELTKLGARVTVEGEGGGDTLEIDPPGAVSARGVSIRTYDDHRMAMSFAVAGTKVGGIAIEEPGCVSKTYPGFFADLERVIGG